MKKLISLIALVAISIVAWAGDTFEVGNLAYEVVTEPSGSTRGNVKCTGLSTAAKSQSNLAIQIPYSVTYGGKQYLCSRIANDAFSGCTNILGASIRCGVRTIGARAFSNCTGMHYIYIPSSIINVFSNAFKGCTNLGRIYCAVVDPKNTYVQTGAFSTGTTTRLYCSYASSLDSYIEKYGSTGFSKIAHAADVYDFQVANGARVVVSSNPLKTNFDELTIVGFTATSSNTNASNGILKFDAATFSTGVYPDQEFRYVAVADSAFYGNTTLKQLDMSACTSLDTIGEAAAKGCTNLTSVNISAKVVGPEAFMNCTSLTTAKWANNLEILERRAFENTALTHDIILPVGFKFISGWVFSGVSSKTILVPSTLQQIASQSFDGMSKLESAYLNWVIDYPIYFDGVPSSCNMYVPVGYLSFVKKRMISSDFTNIQEGAFDFAYKGNLNSAYKMTVTSTNPVTVDGVTYAGKAKYVYSANHGSGTFTASLYETDKMTTGERKYLMTEFGDSCLAYSNYTRVSFVRMTQLSSIGKKAFYGSAITSADLPENYIIFGEDAFSNCTSLTEIVTRTNFNWKGRFFSNNASNFNLYVPNDLVYGKINSALKNCDYNSSNKCSERVAPCFVATASTMPLAVQGNLDFSSSNLPRRPRYVTGFNSSTGTATTTDGLYRALAGRAVMLTDLVEGTFYKIPRYYGTVTSNYTSILVPNASSSRKNIYTVSNAYYWDAVNLKFVKPGSAHYIPSGEAYLVATGGGSEIYLDLFPKASVDGDVNGDGIVDITDVNMTINMVLGKVTKTSAGDINGDGTVDITDVNAVINLMLGK